MSGKDRYESNHPYTMGAKLLAKCRRYEMTTQHRTDDPVHMGFVSRLYKGMRITMDDLQQYSILSSSDYVCSDGEKESPWIRAPIIVSTNRERYTLNHECAKTFALHQGTTVVRWPTKWTRWEQRPGAEDFDEAMLDPCFYEYFVQNADGNITGTINKELSLVNATPVRYHSFVIGDKEDRTRYKTQLTHAHPGDIITLANPPTAINVMITPERMSEELRDRLRSVSIAEGMILIPITPNGVARDHIVPVYGGQTFRPSRVTIKARFPLELAFAITVNKAEGRTLDRVILALSHGSSTGACNMDYRSIYVAFSRVSCNEKIRLLLRGGNVNEQWMSLCYLLTLRSAPSTHAFFAGFSENDNRNWNSGEWDARRACDVYKKLARLKRPVSTATSPPNKKKR